LAAYPHRNALQINPGIEINGSYGEGFCVQDEGHYKGKEMGVLKLPVLRSL